MFKNLLGILGLAVSLSQATIIHWSTSNDTKQLADSKAGDGIYTGWIDLIEFNNGDISHVWGTPDPLLGRYVVMDVNTEKFYVSTSNAPGSIESNALITGTFQLDLSSGNLGTSDGYLLKDVSVNNSIGSAALAEFAETLAKYPGATYTFSAQGSFGNGQLGTVPEPTTMGLMGLGLLGMAAVRRKKKLG